MCSAQKRYGTPQEWVRNMLQPVALGLKLRLFVRNMWTRIRTGSTCCGHYGEPGC